jgi:hypothetical protein
LRVEFRQDLVWLDAIANVGQSFDNATADAKGERRLVFGHDLSGQYDQLADVTLLDCDRPNRARLGSLDLCIWLTAREQQGERRQKQSGPR